jgi:hypothetical protein
MGPRGLRPLEPGLEVVLRSLGGGELPPPLLVTGEELDPRR